MLNDHHADKREKQENCRTCRFFLPSPRCHETGGTGLHVTGDCRRFPPTGTDAGHPTVYVHGYCGEYKEDEHKVNHLKALEAKK